MMNSPSTSSNLGRKFTQASLLLLSSIVVLTACGGGPGSNAVPPPPLVLTGNWQFSMAPPADGSFSGGLEGGFLVDNKGATTGSVAYSVLSGAVCNSGSATVSGTVSGQSVSLTAIAGTQTFTLTGILDLNASTMSGTYVSTAGTAPDGSICGTAQSGLQWAATLVPPLTGGIQGSFYSSNSDIADLYQHEFLVSGGLTQAANTGASSTAVTGNLSFMNTVSNSSDYPCIANAQVKGQISGNTVTLEIKGENGSTIGQVGNQAGATAPLGTVTFEPAQNAYVLHSLDGAAYAVNSPDCPATVAPPSPGDFGSICLALNSSTACAQPITFTPSALLFFSQAVGSPSMLTTTLANRSKSTLSSLTLTFTSDSDTTVYSEIDTCGSAGVPSNQSPFNLSSGQSCVVTITYIPKCSGPCPPTQSATLVLTDPLENRIFTLPISGTPP